MLACWLRLKYPDTFLGAIAASAPVRAYPGMLPAYDWDTYWQVSLAGDWRQSQRRGTETGSGGNREQGCALHSAYLNDMLQQVVTRDASAAVGAAPACQDNVRNTWPIIFNSGATQVRGLV